MSLVGCGTTAGDHAAPRASHGMANGSVSNATAMLEGAEPVGPGAFQNSLLAKSTLAYADYESAMHAMASCVEERAPGTKVTLQPSDYDPRLFDSMYVYGGVEATMSVSNAGEEPDAAPRHERPAPSTTSSPGLDATDPGANPPPSVVARGQTIARCQLEYSAYVEDRWRAQQVLSAAEEKVQKPQFLECLTAAGVKLPSDTSDGNLAKWLGSPAWFSGLTEDQATQATACTTKYVDLINTFAR